MPTDSTSCSRWPKDSIAWKKDGSIAVQWAGAQLTDEDLENFVQNRLDFLLNELPEGQAAVECSVDFSDNMLSQPAPMALLLSRLREAPLHVTTLRLYKNHLGDIVATVLAEHIREAAKKGRPLMQLHLSSNSLTESGVQFLVEAAHRSGGYPRPVSAGKLKSLGPSDSGRRALWLRTENQDPPLENPSGLVRRLQTLGCPVCILESRDQQVPEDTVVQMPEFFLTNLATGKGKGKSDSDMGKGKSDGDMGKGKGNGKGNWKEPEASGNWKGKSSYDSWKGKDFEATTKGKGKGKHFNDVGKGKRSDYQKGAYGTRDSYEEGKSYNANGGIVQKKDGSIAVQWAGAQLTDEDLENFVQNRLDFLLNELPEGQAAVECSVDFSDNMLSQPAPMALLLSRLREAPLHVTTLRLYKNHLGDIVATVLAEHIREAAKKGRPLMQLHLSSNSLTESGVQFLVEAAHRSGGYPRPVSAGKLKSLGPSDSGRRALWLRTENQDPPLENPSGLVRRLQTLGCPVCILESRDQQVPEDTVVQMPEFFLTNLATGKGKGKSDSDMGKGKSDGDMGKGKGNGKGNWKEPEASGNWKGKSFHDSWKGKGSDATSKGKDKHVDDSWKSKEPGTTGKGKSKSFDDSLKGKSKPSPQGRKGAEVSGDEGKGRGGNSRSKGAGAVPGGQADATEPHRGPSWESGPPMDAMSALDKYLSED
eukprot:TRINITY_DN3104_c0_g1_i1.p1 TRINITY_DN3104_c0_g1~~TRINITY_DN3104_c0_g1_i1.p1  ORF type:complete len:704 (+),score=150.59 TRINITY_DN3104_c0_g1_i1:66-2177(+)